MKKTDAARRQLGTALHLYLANLDPISVHVLASGGGEVASALAVKAAAKPFHEFTLEIYPDLSRFDLQTLRNKYWNAMKHSHSKNGVERNDEELLSLPLTEENEARLAEGWFDLAQSGMPLPIEAQVFNLWFLAKHGDHTEFDGWQDDLFPNLLSLSPDQQKAMLREKIKMARENLDVALHPKTDARPLILA